MLEFFASLEPILNAIFFVLGAICIIAFFVSMICEFIKTFKRKNASNTQKAEEKSNAILNIAESITDIVDIFGGD